MINNIIKNLSKIVFIFIIFVVIAGGVVRHILSCQMQSYLNKNITIKHLIGIILIFLFIMLEGGWDFNKEELEKAPNDWSSGNVIHTMIYAIMIYSVFLITARSRLIPNIILYSLLFIIYLINTQRNYWFVRNNINEETNKKIIKLELLILFFAIIVTIYGFIDYVIYKKKNLKKSFDWIKFFLSTRTCSFDGSKEIKLPSTSS